MLPQLFFVCQSQAAAGASEPSAAGGGERASADGAAQAAGVAATASSAELGAAAEAQSEGASEPRAQQQAGADSAMQPAEESGELPGTAPRLGELAYATGEWAQWSHHWGYKEPLQLLAQWESVNLPTRRQPTGPELRARFLVARQRQAARPSSRTPE